DLETGLATMTREQFADRIRAELPAGLRGVEFEVDIATQGTKAFNPLTEETDVVLYDPLDGRYQRSKVIDLFRRLPLRIALCRIFAQDGSHARQLTKAADRALSR